MEQVSPCDSQAVPCDFVLRWIAAHMSQQCGEALWCALAKAATSQGRGKCPESPSVLFLGTCSRIWPELHFIRNCGFGLFVDTVFLLRSSLGQHLLTRLLMSLSLPYCKWWDIAWHGFGHVQELPATDNIMQHLGQPSALYCSPTELWGRFGGLPWIFRPCSVWEVGVASVSLIEEIFP